MASTSGVRGSASEVVLATVFFFLLPTPGSGGGGGGGGGDGRGGHFATKEAVMWRRGYVMEPLRKLDPPSMKVALVPESFEFEWLLMFESMPEVPPVIINWSIVAG